MTLFKKNKIFSLFLVLALVFTMLPTAAFAAESEDTHTHEEVSAAESEIVLDEEAPNTYEEKLAMMAEDTESAEPGYIEWLLDQNNILHIGGYGYIADFTSADDQPWKYQREQITAVMFDGEDQPEYDSTAYWFDGCTNLDPENIFDYEMCLLLKESAPYAYSDCGVTGCTCTGRCNSEYRNYRTAENPDQYHIMTVYCAGCGATYGIIVTGSHTFSGNTCTLCGYTKSCSHSSTTQRFITGCDWQRTCNSCGAVVSTGTTHGPYTYSDWAYYNSTYHRRTYTCSYGDSGTYSETERHSTTITYGQYSSTQHSVNSYCATCGTTISSSYANHSFTYGSWQNYSSTQHRRTKTCSTCGYSTYEYASHSLTNGSWTSADAAQHKRTVSCSCGYSTTEYASHSLTYGNWTVCEGDDYSTQHKRTVSCSCGYRTTEYEEHDCYADGEWKYSDSTFHTRHEKCDCGYKRDLYTHHRYTTTRESVSNTEHSVVRYCSACEHTETTTEAHDLTHDEWSPYDEEQHKRVNACSCGYSADEYGDHVDTDNDDYCDSCDYLMSRFSVTVPATLNLTVAKDGTVYAATTAQIVNNSTDTVSVTSIKLNTENGWQLVPYSTNMANAKVDARLIGFYLNGAESDGTENLPMSHNWQIAKDDALTLDYDAVVSATSDPINEQVLTIVFVLDWAK